MSSREKWTDGRILVAAVAVVVALIACCGMLVGVEVL
jgi:hypothetical protein